jgi:cullin-associated NEDD8-dissociated protein 1
LLPLFFAILNSQVALAAVKKMPSIGSLLRSFVLPQALVLAASPLLQDLTLDSLLELFEAMVIAGVISVQDMRSAALDKLPKGNENLASKSTVINLAKCIAITTCAAGENVQTETVRALIQSLGIGSNNLLLQLNLLTSGEIGQRLDLNLLGGSEASQLRTLFIRYLDDSNEEVRTAAAYALGHAAVGSKEVFLPPIVEAFESSSQKKQYLLLSSLQEVVKCHQKNRKNLATSVSVIVPHLIQHFSAKEEGVRKMVADCIGSLCCFQPLEILPLLQQLTVAHAGKHVRASETDGDSVNADSLICWTIATSIKNAVSNKVQASEMLPVMPTFLTLLKEEDLSAKLASLIMVYATVHHMPELLSCHMKDLVVPSLQEVSKRIFVIYFYFRMYFVTTVPSLCLFNNRLPN